MEPPLLEEDAVIIQPAVPTKTNSDPPVTNKPANEASRYRREGNGEATLMEEMVEANKAAVKVKQQEHQKEMRQMTEEFGDTMANAMKENLKQEKLKQKEMLTKVNQLKNKGNEALKQNKLDDALDFYSKAIELDPKNHILYSNRSVVFIKFEKFESALSDSIKCIECNKKWPKGYLRKANALKELNRSDEAVKCFKLGLKNCNKDKDLQIVFRKSYPTEYKSWYDDANMTYIQSKPQRDLVTPTSQSTPILPEVQEAMKKEQEAQLLNTLSNGNWANELLMKKLMSNPLLSVAMQDPRFSMVLQAVQNNPTQALKQFENDPPMLKVVTELMRVLGEHFNELGDLQEKQRQQQQQATIQATTSTIQTKEESELQRQADEILKNQNVRDILADPEMQRVMQQCTQPGVLPRFMNDPVWGPKLKVLAAAGVFSIE